VKMLKLFALITRGRGASSAPLRGSMEILDIKGSKSCIGATTGPGTNQRSSRFPQMLSLQGHGAC